jgi:hypothetical protein
VLDAFPYPIAHIYRRVVDAGLPSTTRCAALDATAYELLRVVGLSLVSQYLRESRDEATEPREGRSDGGSALHINRAVTALQCPHFSDWILLARTLDRHLPRVVARPLFPELGPALKALGVREERPVGLRGQRELAPLEAMLALRNYRTHSGLWDVPERAGEATELLHYYVPVLHAILGAFGFLGDVRLVVREGEWPSVTGRVLVRTLRGARLRAPEEVEVTPGWDGAFAESATILTTADGRVLPLDPLISRLEGRAQPVYLYDGHYSVPQPEGGPAERRLVIRYQCALNR